MRYLVVQNSKHAYHSIITSLPLQVLFNHIQAPHHNNQIASQNNTLLVFFTSLSFDRKILVSCMNVAPKYPFHQVVSRVLHYFGKEKDRSKINILELGCGTANNIYFLAKEGFNASGLDGSEHAIKLGRTFLAENGLKATLLCQDFINLSNFADQSFDMVIDRGSITHNRRKCSPI